MSHQIPISPIDWEASRASVARLAELEPEVAITGHGRAMHGPEMRFALRALARDFDRIAVPESGRYVDKPATVEAGTAYEGEKPPVVAAAQPVTRSPRQENL